VIQPAVIFDMDGVLIDSKDAHRRSWVVLAEEHRRTVSDEEFAAQFGRPSRDIIRSLFGAELDDERVRRMDERKEGVYRDLIRGQVPEMPGAVALVRALHEAGLRLAVGSSGPPENICLALDELGVRDCFTAVVTGMDVTHGKPHPEPFLLAAARLGAEPRHCVVVEDAPAGIEAALHAEMVVIALTGTHDRCALARATHVVDSLAEINVALVHTLVDDGAGPGLEAGTPSA
jgi:beta-phosphoglucomutase